MSSRYGMHRYTPSTAGEELCQFLFRKLDDGKAWRYLENVLRPIGNPSHLSAYYQHHAAVFLACKLITAGKIYAEPTYDPDLLAPMVADHPWNRFNSENRLLRFLSAALKSSGRPISPGTAANLRRFALEKHPHCYICGRDLEFEVEASDSFFSADHLWPSSYGGDSTEENLLPACKICNQKKANVVSWVSTDVHSLFVVNSDKDHLAYIEFKHRFAIFNRFAITVAIDREITLKQAFIAIGPWCETRVSDDALVADMFSILTHPEDIEADFS